MRMHTIAELVFIDIYTEVKIITTYEWNKDTATKPTSTSTEI